MKKVFKKSVLFGLLILLIGFSSSQNWTGTETLFDMEGIQCRVTENPKTSTWVNVSSTGTETNTELIFNVTSNLGNCSKYPILSQLGCCPSGYSCDFVSGQCKPEARNFCENFTTKESCEGPDSTLFGALTMTSLKLRGYERCNTFSQDQWYDSDGGACLNQTICACTWNDIKKTCDVERDELTYCEEMEFQSSNNCTYTLESKEVKCDSIGKVIVKYTATASPSSYLDCNDQQIEYPCSVTAVVPFFTLPNFIISLFSLSFIYLFLRKHI